MLPWCKLGGKLEKSQFARGHLEIHGWNHGIKEYKAGGPLKKNKQKSEVGGCSTGKSFRFVRACVRAVWLPSGIGSKWLLAILFPFPFWARGAFPFPFPPPPNLLSNVSWAYRHVTIIQLYCAPPAQATPPRPACWQLV